MDKNCYENDEQKEKPDSLIFNNLMMVDILIYQEVSFSLY